MKKLFALATVSLFAFTACGGSGAISVTDKNENLTNYLVDLGCMLAKYNGKIIEAEIQALDKKYNFAARGPTQADLAIKLLTADEATELRAKALPMITAKCKDDFARSSFTPESFLDVAILPAQLNK